MKKHTLIHTALASLIVVSLGGCATTDMQLETKATNSIFLDPIKKGQKTVYVEVKNTSKHDIGTFEESLKQKLVAKGYTFSQNPADAEYILMTNVLFAANVREAAQGGAIAGGTFLGATSGALSSGNGGGFLVGAVAGAAVGAVAANVARDEYYRFVTDVVVREKKTNDTSAPVENGTQYTQYTMRVFSQAYKMNLDVNAAMPAMVEQTTEQIAGVF